MDLSGQLSWQIRRWGLLWLYLHRVAVGRILLLPPLVGATWERFVSAIVLALVGPEPVAVVLMLVMPTFWRLDL
jgi:hypothetical protein